MPMKERIHSSEDDKKSLLDVLLGCRDGRGGGMLVNKAGRSKRSLGGRAEGRLCMRLMPSRDGYATQVKDKGIGKKCPTNENTIYVYKF